MGLVLSSRGTRELAHPFLSWKAHEKVNSYDSDKRPSPDTAAASTLIMDFTVYRQLYEIPEMTAISEGRYKRITSSKPA